ncbi:uncharacterized protein LOC125657854 [Ostrea edulis]|uniref:uncharacterized protein LOC125657854 n=1 Tax=Ostrea edulis TaxID=37623 RepID=UPI0024AEB9B8|nr:uncharacterized protein LOC125657854 [Ostrea edulis]
MFLKIIFALFLVGTPSAFQIRDPCTLSFWNTPEIATKNTSCSSGSILWNYPEGRIRVQFLNVPDQVCITRGVAAYGDVISNIYYENGDRHEGLQFNAEGKACITPTGEEASVVFQGPTRMRTYMASFAYEITSEDRSIVDRMQSTFINIFHTAIRPLGTILRKWNIQINIDQM